MKFGVRDDQVIVYLGPNVDKGYSMHSDELRTPAARKEVADELLGAVYLLVRKDFNSFEEFMDYATTSLETR